MSVLDRIATDGTTRVATDGTTRVVIGWGLNAGSYSINGASANLVNRALGVTDIGTANSPSTGTPASGTLTIATPAVPAGSLIVVAVLAHSGFKPASITDTAGNTYVDTRAGVQPLFVGAPSNASLTTYYCANCSALSAGNTISIHAPSSNSDFYSASAVYATGVKAVSPREIEVHTSNNTTSTGGSLASGTPSLSRELFIAFAAADETSGGSSITSALDTGHGWATPPNQAKFTKTASNIDQILNGGNKVVTNGLAQTLTTAYNVSCAWAAQILSFKPNSSVLAESSGVYTISGKVATLLASPRVMKLGVGTYSINGGAAQFNVAEPWAAGAYALTGRAAAMLAARVLGGVGTYTLTGRAAATLASHVLRASVGAYSLNGVAAQFNVAEPWSAGVYAVAGQAAALLASHILKANAGAYSLNGDTVQFSVAEPWAAGAYTLTGQPAAMFASHVLNANAGAYSLSGDAAQFNVVEPMAPGVYTLAGQPAAMIASHVLGTDAGAYALTGQPAAMIASHVLSADAGAYSINGDDAQFGVAERLASGAYTLTGQPAAMIASHVLSANAGAYSINGDDAQFGVAEPLAAGAYNVNGGDAALLRGAVLPGASGAYAIDGTDAALIHTGAGAIVLPCSRGAYLLQGTDAALLTARKLRSARGGYHIAGRDSGMNLPQGGTIEFNIFGRLLAAQADMNGGDSTPHDLLPWR